MCYDDSARTTDLFLYARVYFGGFVMKKGRKILPEEVAVLSAGEQIRRKVLGSGRTIEDFAREINFYPVSVKQYLRRDDGGSSSFKIKLTQYFRQGYDEIVKNPSEQLTEKCRNLSDNIHLYTEEADATVIGNLFTLVEEAAVDGLIPWMERNLAMNHFYRNRISDALGLLGSAEKRVRESRDFLAQVTFAADLALVNYYLCEYETALAWITEAEEALVRLASPSSKLKFLVAFRGGVIHSRTERHADAIVAFKGALAVADEETFVGLGNLYLAEALYRSGSLQEAKEAYRQALSALENDPLRQSFVYNSFAEMLLSENDIQRAGYFAEKAMGLCEGDNVLYSFQHFETYAKIRIRMGGYQQVCVTLVDMIEKSIGEFIYRNQILEALRILLDCFEEIGIDMSDRMESLILGLIEGASDEEQNYTRVLKSYLNELANRKISAYKLPG